MVRVRPGFDYRRGRMNRNDLLWLAGLLEGEGSFLKGPPSHPNQPIVVTQMTDEDVVQRVASLLGTSMVRNKQDKRKSHWKPTFSARLRGKKAVELMELLRPLMGKRRGEQINRAIASYKVLQETLTAAQVREIRKRCSRGENMQMTATIFGVSYSTITKIKYRKIWKNV